MDSPEAAVRAFAQRVSVCRRDASPRKEDFARARELRDAAEGVLEGRLSPRARKLRKDLDAASQALEALEARTSATPARPRAAQGVGQFFAEDEEVLTPGRRSSTSTDPSTPGLPELVQQVEPLRIFAPPLVVGTPDSSILERLDANQVLLVEDSGSAQMLEEVTALAREAEAVRELQAQLAEQVDGQGEPLRLVETRMDQTLAMQKAGNEQLLQATSRRFSRLPRLYGLTGATVGLTTGTILGVVTHACLLGVGGGLAVGTAGGVAVGRAMKRQWRRRQRAAEALEKKPELPESAEKKAAYVPRNTNHMLMA